MSRAPKCPRCGSSRISKCVSTDYEWDGKEWIPGDIEVSYDCNACGAWEPDADADEWLGSKRIVSIKDGKSQ